MFIALRLLLILSQIQLKRAFLMNGIRILSDINTKFFLVLAAFAFIAGPTVYILSAAVDGLGAYLGSFFERSLFTGAIAEDKWPQWWSKLYLNSP